MSNTPDLAVLAAGLHELLFSHSRAWRGFYAQAVKHHWWGNHVSCGCLCSSKSVHLSWTFFFLLILPFCFAFSVSSFQLWFLWGILGSEVLIQSWWAGIHSYRKDSPIVSLVSSQGNFFNDLTIAHLHFCLCKITWSLTAAAWERALVLLKGIGQGWALC